jgi:DNA-binding MarR family transcriptional regulator
MRLYARLTAGLDGALDETTCPVASGLDRLGPATAARLAADIGLDRSVVSRHATRLERAGLLERQPDPSGQRGTLLALTARGRALVARMRARLAAALDERLAAWRGRGLRRRPAAADRRGAVPLEPAAVRTGGGWTRPYHPSSASRASSMPKWCATSCTTVRLTWSATSSSVAQMAQIAWR